MVEQLTQNQINALCRFQKQCQKKLLINCLLRFKKVFYDTRKLAYKKPGDHNPIYEMNKNFDALASHLRRKEVISIANAIVKRVYRYIDDENVAPKMNGRDLMGIFCFAGFPEVVLMDKELLNNNKSSLDYDVYMIARKLIGAWGIVLISNDKDEATRKFIKLINMYSNCFRIWMNKDKISKVNELIKQWYDIGKTLNEVSQSDKYEQSQKEITIETIKISQNKIKSMIKAIDSNFDLSSLDKYIALYDQIEIGIEKGFWDMLREQLAEGKSIMFLDLIKQVHAEVISLLPNKNGEVKSKIVEEIDSFYNMETIEKITLDESITGEEFIRLADRFLAVLLILQAPSRSENMVKEWNELLESIHKEKDDVERGVKILKFLFKETKAIKENIINLSILADLGFNPFNFE